MKIDKNNPQQVLNYMHEKVAMVVPDYDEYLVFQIRLEDKELFYNINNRCPKDKQEKIEGVILDNASLFNLSATTEDID